MISVNHVNGNRNLDWHKVHDSLENPARNILDLKPFIHIKGK